MAITVPDLKLIKTSYSNLYQLTGITVGKPLILQNKSSVNAYVQISEKAPSASSLDGFLIEPNKFLLIQGGNMPGCWAIGSGRISVQEYD